MQRWGHLGSGLEGGFWAARCWPRSSRLLASRLVAGYLHGGFMAPSCVRGALLAFWWRDGPIVVTKDWLTRNGLIPRPRWSEQA